ncbi:MAG: DUF424 domain-containing protein [Methanoregula sp.]|nr:DUF424 domain-containing protein [Methanoregula sp.]
MFLKIHRSPGSGDVVAVCDRELINTTISHEKITVMITESFYGSKPATEEDVRAALNDAGNINLMGERSVSLAVAMGLITRSNCIMIGKIPHVQIYHL